MQNHSFFIRYFIGRRCVGLYVRHFCLGGRFKILSMDSLHSCGCSTYLADDFRNLYLGVGRPSFILIPWGINTDVEFFLSVLILMLRLPEAYGCSSVFSNLSCCYGIYSKHYLPLFSHGYAAILFENIISGVMPGIDPNPAKI